MQKKLCAFCFFFFYVSESIKIAVWCRFVLHFANGGCAHMEPVVTVTANEEPCVPAVEPLLTPSYPETLAYDDISALHWSREFYDRFGPVLLCPCERTTSHQTRVTRRCLVSRYGTMYILRPDDGKDKDAGTLLPHRVSHIVPLNGSTGIDIRFFTKKQQVPGLDADSHKHHDVSTQETQIVISSMRRVGGSEDPVEVHGSQVELWLSAPFDDMFLHVCEYFAQQSPKALKMSETHWEYKEIHKDSPWLKIKRGAAAMWRRKKTTEVLDDPLSADLRQVAMHPSPPGYLVSVPQNQPAGFRPDGLKHFHRTQTVPLDVLKRRPKLPPQQLDVIRRKLYNLYSAYAPEKLHTVDDLLLKYEGIEDLLLLKVASVYGPATLSTCSDPNNEDSLSWGARKRNGLIETSNMAEDLSVLEITDQKPSHSVTVDNTDDDDDDVTTIVDEIHVLERACDRLSFQMLRAALIDDDDAPSNAPTTCRPPQNMGHFNAFITEQRIRAVSLSQLVSRICATKRKVAMAAVEEKLHMDFLTLATQQPAHALT